MLIESGHVAVVTGAAQGLGRAIAAELLGRGVRVVLADLHTDVLQATARELDVDGAATLPVAVDVTDADAMAALAERTLDQFGRIDLVMNNAGVVPGDGKPLWEADLVEFRRVVDVNLFGVLHGIRAFVPHLVAAGRGHVVNTASIAGLAGTPMSAAYGTSKHAVVAASEGLRAELDIFGHAIGVTVVCPGFVRTPMVAGTWDTAEAERWAEQFGEDSATILDVVQETMRDMLEPDEAARRILAAVEADQLHALPSGDVADGARSRAQRVLDAIAAANG